MLECPLTHGPAAGDWERCASLDEIAAASNRYQASGVLNALGTALVSLALRILSLPDEAWARWQPLPDAPRRRRAPFPAERLPRHPRRRR